MSNIQSFSKVEEPFSSKQKIPKDEISHTKETEVFSTAINSLNQLSEFSDNNHSYHHLSRSEIRTQIIAKKAKNEDTIANYRLHEPTSEIIKNIINQKQKDILFQLFVFDPESDEPVHLVNIQPISNLHGLNFAHIVREEQEIKVTVRGNNPPPSFIQTLRNLEDENGEKFTIVIEAMSDEQFEMIEAEVLRYFASLKPNQKKTKEKHSDDKHISDDAKTSPSPSLVTETSSKEKNQPYKVVAQIIQGSCLAILLLKKKKERKREFEKNILRNEHQYEHRREVLHHIIKKEGIEFDQKKRKEKNNKA